MIRQTKFAEGNYLCLTMQRACRASELSSDRRCAKYDRACPWLSPAPPYMPARGNEMEPAENVYTIFTACVSLKALLAWLPEKVNLGGTRA